MAFRLRYLNRDLPLVDGAFFVGRSATCQLSFDDPLVSRRHAQFIVAGGRVWVEDLASRNGVVVNGQRVEGRVELQVGDVVIIGNEPISLVDGNEPAVDPYAPGTLPKIAVAAPSEDGLDATGMTQIARTSQAFTAIRDASDLDVEGSVARRSDQFKLLGGVAEKAFAMGRPGDAERVLASSLADVIEATRAGKRLPPALLEQAARYSAKLATATGKGGWADYVVELYAAHGRPPPALVIDELHAAMRKATNFDRNRFRAYVAQLREIIGSLGPADRFLVQRLEGLERLVAFV